jgi:hypothetical protein
LSPTPSFNEIIDLDSIMKVGFYKLHDQYVTFGTETGLFGIWNFVSDTWLTWPVPLDGVDEFEPGAEPETTIIEVKSFMFLLYVFFY